MLAGRVLSLLFQYSRITLKNQVLIRQPISEKYLKLGVDNAPITPFPRPLLSDVHHRQIQHFQQAVIGREYGFRLGNLAKLAVEALYGVGSINQRSNLLRVYLKYVDNFDQLASHDCAIFGYLAFHFSPKDSNSYKAVSSSTAA